jgi:hypothetical protein
VLVGLTTPTRKAIQGACASEISRSERGRVRERGWQGL